MKTNLIDRICSAIDFACYVIDSINDDFEARQERIGLHVKVMFKNHQWKWHLKGIAREFKPLR